MGFTPAENAQPEVPHKEGLACVECGARETPKWRGIGGRLSAERDAATSLLPFGALLTGAQSWARLAEEVKWSNAALALAGGVALAATRRRAALRLAVIR